MRNFISAIALCLSFVIANAQNALPVISDVKLSADAAKQVVTVTYNLADPDNDALKVDVMLSNDNGNSFLIKPTNVSGDAGQSVTKGKNKKLSFSYSPQQFPALSAMKVKLVANDLYKINVQELVDQVDSVRVRKNVERIYGERHLSTEQGKQQLENTRKLLMTAFTGSNLQAGIQDTRMGELPVRNVIAKKPGTNELDVYIVCAHYDAVEKSPGADDNASGVAALMEIATILSKYNFSSTIKFIGFDLEEAGSAGARVYIAERASREPDRLMGVVNFDMIGYYSDAEKSQSVPPGFETLFPKSYEKVAKDGFRGNFILITANERSKFLADEFEKAGGQYVPSLKSVSAVLIGKGEAVPPMRSGDHGEFWEFEVPAINIGDGANTRNKHYHAQSDVLETLNYPFMVNVIKASLAMIVKMAQVEHSTVVVKGFEQ